jgi:hypothetical protein
MMNIQTNTTFLLQSKKKDEHNSLLGPLFFDDVYLEETKAKKQKTNKERKKEENEPQTQNINWYLYISIDDQPLS